MGLRSAEATKTIAASTTNTFTRDMTVSAKCESGNNQKKVRPKVGLASSYTSLVLLDLIRM
jgi:hypothetical protein